jgi:uncharacterized protein YndB with AHSA1/START domain
MAKASDPEDREIVAARTIEAPRRLVFEAYTDARHLGEWWGPNGFTTTTRAFEFRVGGVWDFVMHGPDGTDYPNWIEWREIAAPERIVFLHGERGGDPQAFIATVTFSERGGATEIVMRAVFPTRERRAEVVERYGALEGAKQTLERLAAHIASIGEKSQVRTATR